MSTLPRSPQSLRVRLSEALIQGAFERTLTARELERRIAEISPDSPGYYAAYSAVRSAQRAEAVLLWLGFRLRPGHGR